jgi:uncharacterized UPF0160 family protein
MLSLSDFNNIKMEHKKITIVTHSGQFHTDDVFAVATLQLLLEKNFSLTIIRTRDEKIINDANYVVDVGEVYDPEAKRFDHHQGEGAGVRGDGIPYASFGLVWKEYGKEVCGGDADIAASIEQKIVKPVDAMDNGISFMKSERADLFMYDLKDLTFTYKNTWKEGDDVLDKNFEYLTGFAKELIKREISVLKDIRDGDKEVHKIIAQQQDKTLLILDKPYQYELVVSMYHYILLVVHPKRQDGTWAVETSRDSVRSYESRIQLPEEWAGKRSDELVKLTGVHDAVFCHRGRFIAVAKSREGVLKLAHIALERAGKSLDR